jgi:hypothetical protein
MGKGRRTNKQQERETPAPVAILIAVLSFGNSTREIAVCRENTGRQN